MFYVIEKFELGISEILKALNASCYTKMNFLEKVPEIYGNPVVMRLLFDSLLK